MVSETRETVTPSGPCPTGPVKLGRRLFDRRRQLQPHLRMPACPGVIIVSDRRVADDLATHVRAGPPLSVRRAHPVRRIVPAAGKAVSRSTHHTTTVDMIGRSSGLV